MVIFFHVFTRLVSNQQILTFEEIFLLFCSEFYYIDYQYENLILTSIVIELRCVN